MSPMVSVMFVKGTVYKDSNYSKEKLCNGEKLWFSLAFTHSVITLGHKDFVNVRGLGIFIAFSLLFFSFCFISNSLLEAFT